VGGEGGFPIKKNRKKHTTKHILRNTVRHKRHDKIAHFVINKLLENTRLMLVLPCAHYIYTHLPLLPVSRSLPNV